MKNTLIKFVKKKKKTTNKIYHLYNYLQNKEFFFLFHVRNKNKKCRKCTSVIVLGFGPGRYAIIMIMPKETGN